MTWLEIKGVWDTYQSSWHFSAILLSGSVLLIAWPVHGYSRANRLAWLQAKFLSFIRVSVAVSLPWQASDAHGSNIIQQKNKKRWLQRTGRVELYLNDDFWGSLGSGSSPSASSSTFATLAFKQLQWRFIKWCQHGRNVSLARYSFILNSCMVSSVALQILVTHALLSKKFQICMPFLFFSNWGEILQIDLRELQIDV